jgi:hypothetical protein
MSVSQQERGGASVGTAGSGQCGLQGEGECGWVEGPEEGYSDEGRWGLTGKSLANKLNMSASPPTQARHSGKFYFLD